VTWSKAPIKITNDVSQLTISPSPTKGGFQLAIGTAASKEIEGSNYTIESTPISWGQTMQVAVPTSVAKILDVSPGNIWKGKGLYTLYERYDKTTGCTFDTMDSRFHFKLQTLSLGKVRGMFINSNPWK
jgi:hypothetical protein